MPASAHPPHPEPRSEETRVGIRDLRRDLSTWLRRAEAGETIVVTDRGRAIARLGPEPKRPMNSIERGIADGTITPATVDKSVVLAMLPLPVGEGPSLSEIVLQMRDEDPR